MTPLPVDFHPRAVADAKEARRWYAQRSPEAARRFVSELKRVVEQIATTPERWPPHLYGTRFYRLRRFPYIVVYRRIPDTVQVVAVAHGRRKPGYWRKRIP
jgi:plasmid stabilization system protein ParE